MFFRLLLAFIIVPLADLAVLMIVSKYLTWPVTMLLVILTGVLGAWLARLQWQWLIVRLKTRQQPASLSEVLSDGAMILFAGALLVTPGFLTDLFGLTLLIPQCRRWYRSYLAKRLSDGLQIQVFSTYEMEEDGVVDGWVTPENHESDDSDFESDLHDGPSRLN